MAQRGLPSFDVKLGTLVQSEAGQQQKMVDMLLALDLITTAFHERIQNVAMVTGDTDFVPAIEKVKSIGIKVLVVHGRRAGFDLMRSADHAWFIDQNFVDSIRCESAHPQCACTSSPQKPEPTGCALPAATRSVSAGDATRVEEGEIVDVVAGASAVITKGGVAIARPGSTIHALKGAKVHLFHDVVFTGTKGFTLVPAV